MPFPPPSGAPTPFVPGFNYTNYQSLYPTVPLPANQVDNDYADLKTTTDSLIFRLQQVQRSDGALVNQSVMPITLDPSVLALMGSGNWIIGGTWAANTAYAANTLIIFSGSSYLSAVAHTSSSSFQNDLAAGDWVPISGGAVSAPAGTIFSNLTALPTQAAYNTLIATQNSLDQGRIDVTAATTTLLGAAASPYVRIAGIATITTFDTVSAGIKRFSVFSAAATLVNSASLILPGGANIVTASGDCALFISEGGGIWRCLDYTPIAVTLSALNATVSTLSATVSTISSAVSTATPLASLSSPAFTGIPTVPTAATTVNTTQAASTAFAHGLSAATPGFKNLLIGGDFGANPWQRGTSFTSISSTAALTYGADRWGVYLGASGGSVYVNQQAFGAGTIPMGISGAIRVGRTSASTSTARISLVQVIESLSSFQVGTNAFALSFWAQAGANYSGGAVGATVTTGVVPDQGSAAFISGWTGTSALSTNVTITSSWVRYTIPFSGFNAFTAELAVSLSWTPAGTAGANDWIQFADIQLEIYPFATAFETRPAALEIGLCRRYYMAEQMYVGGIVSGSATSTYLYPTRMRATPTISGGGAGFSVALSNPALSVLSQTTAGGQNLVFNAEL